MRAIALLAVGAAQVACHPPLAPQTQGGGAELNECDPMACGVNGVWLGRNIAFHELDAGGAGDFRDAQPNDAGLEITAFKLRGQSLRLRVDRDELVGIQPDGVELRRTALRNATLDLTGGGFSYRLTFKDVRCIDYWADSRGEELEDFDCTAPTKVPVFDFVYIKLGYVMPPTPVSICGPEAEVTDYTRKIQGAAVIFRGERYAGVPARIVETGQDDTWFNIACARTTLAKLHLERHTLAAADDRHSTTIDQRQTLLRMLMGDYCGSGKYFTQNGHELRYRYLQKWDLLYPQHDLTDIHTIDAVWSSGGAVCLGQPRLADRQLESSLRAAIEGECQRVGHPLPDCSGTELAAWRDQEGQCRSGESLCTLSNGGYAISANPATFQPVSQ